MLGLFCCNAHYFVTLHSRVLIVYCVDLMYILSCLYTEFIMADGSVKPKYENMKARRVRPIQLAYRSVCGVIQIVAVLVYIFFFI